MKQLKVVIDRGKWCVPPNTQVAAKNPDHYHSGLLLDSRGLQCCLGFVGRVCKIPKKQLLNNGTPTSVEDKYINKWPKNFFMNKNIGSLDIAPTVSRLMSTNDSESKKMTNSYREDRITALGKKIGIKFSFIGKYLKAKKSQA